MARGSVLGVDQAEAELQVLRDGAAAGTQLAQGGRLAGSSGASHGTARSMPSRTGMPHRSGTSLSVAPRPVGPPIDAIATPASGGGR
jgi:hypothetical protein